MNVVWLAFSLLCLALIAMGAVFGTLSMIDKIISDIFFKDWD